MAPLAGLEELEQALEEDSQQEARYPTRILLVGGVESWGEAVLLLKRYAGSQVCLSQFCAGQDLLPNYRQALDKAFSATGSVLFLPVAELLRLFPAEGAACLKVLLAREEVGHRRIYVPLLLSRDAFEKVARGLSRYSAGELPRPWEIGGEKPLRLYVSRHLIPGVAKAIEGLQHYLELMEQGYPAPEELNLVTGVAELVRDSDDTGVLVRSLPTAYAVARHVLSLPVEIHEEWGQEGNWAWLISQAQPGDTLQSLSQRELNVFQYNAQDLLGRWGVLDAQRRWLAWLWARSQEQPGSYFQEALQQALTPDRLPEAIYTAALRVTPREGQLQERRRLLGTLAPVQLPAGYERELRALPPRERLLLLTGLTEQERCLAVETVRELLLAGADERSWLESLAAVYPALYFYLLGCPGQEGMAERYLAKYRRARLRGELDEELVELCAAVAKQKALYKFETRGAVLEKSCVPLCLWADGLGAEWAGVLTGTLEEETGLKAEIHLARAALPTLTETNRGWEGKQDVEEELDRIAHSARSSFPQAFARQLEVVQSLARRAARLARERGCCLLTADHGLTAFHHTGEPIGLPEGWEVEKWGRCARVVGEGAQSEKWVVENGYAVLTVHGRFKGGAGYTWLAHGGATLEEALVPVLVIRSIGPAPRVLVVSCPQRLSLRPDGTAELAIEVSAQLSELAVSIRGQSFAGESEDWLHWRFALKGQSPGRASLRFLSGGERIGEREVEFVAGVIEEDLGI